MARGDIREKHKTARRIILLSLITGILKKKRISVNLKL